MSDIIFYLIQANFIDVVITIFIYIFLLTSTTMDKQKKHIFFITTLIISILIVADSTDFYLKQQYTYPPTLRYITSATGYTLRPAMIMFMLFIPMDISWKRKCILSIPLVANSLIAYSSVFTHIMFYFDETNQFYRGPIGFLPFAVSGLYMIILITSSVKMYRLGNKLEASTVFLIAVMGCVGVIMESIFHFKFILNGIGAISVVFYYVFLNTQTYKRDALTSALNRHSFYLDVEYMSNRPMLIVSIDLNNLKLINDIQGHDIGDKAIITVSNTVFKHLPHNYHFYRVGGDEFIILCPKAKIDTLKKIMNKITTDVSAEGYQLAWGWAAYEPGMDFQQQLKQSDENMYKNKMHLKMTDGLMKI